MMFYMKNIKKINCALKANFFFAKNDPGTWERLDFLGFSILR